jgi:hypothetical protein
MADEDFSAVEAKALKSGASKVYVIDLQVCFSNRSFSLSCSLALFGLFNRPINRPNTPKLAYLIFFSMISLVCRRESLKFRRRKCPVFISSPAI